MNAPLIIFLCSDGFCNLMILGLFKDWFILGLLEGGSSTMYVIPKDSAHPSENHYKFQSSPPISSSCVYFLLYVVWENIVMVKEITVKILTALYIDSTPEYKNVLYVRRYCHVERISIAAVMDLHVFTPSEYKILFFWVLCVCMVRQVLFIFNIKSLSVVGQCPVSMIVLAFR
jgi:hypothetical protein